MIPKLETISTRPVELTAPEFTRPVKSHPRRLDVSYEDIAGMMAQQEQCLGGAKSDPRYALMTIQRLSLSERGQDRVHVRNVRVVDCAVCTECGGFVDLFGDSHISEGMAERRYFHMDCYIARQAVYARLEDEGE